MLLSVFGCQEIFTSTATSLAGNDLIGGTKIQLDCHCEVCQGKLLLCVDQTLDATVFGIRWCLIIQEI